METNPKYTDYIPAPKEVTDVKLSEFDRHFVDILAQSLHADWYYHRLIELKDDPEVILRANELLQEGVDKDEALLLTAQTVGSERNEHIRSWMSLTDEQRQNSIRQAEEAVKIVQQDWLNIENLLKTGDLDRLNEQSDFPPIYKLDSLFEGREYGRFVSGMFVETVKRVLSWDNQLHSIMQKGLDYNDPAVLLKESIYETEGDKYEELIDDRLNFIGSELENSDVKKNWMDYISDKYLEFKYINDIRTDSSYSLMKFAAINNREFQAYFGSKEAVTCFFERFERLFPSDSVNCLKNRIDRVSYNQDSPDDVKKGFRGYVGEVFPELDPEVGERMLLWFNENILRISSDDYCNYPGCMLSDEGFVVPVSSDMGDFMLNGKPVFVRESDSMYDNRIIRDGKTLFSHGPYAGVKKLCLDYPDGQVDYEVLVIPSGHGKCRPGIGSESDFKTFDIYADNGERLFERVTFEVVKGVRGLTKPVLCVTKGGSTTTYSSSYIRDLACKKYSERLDMLSSIGVGESFKAVMANERAKNLKPTLTPAGLFSHVIPQGLEMNMLPYGTSVYIDKDGKKLLQVDNYEKYEVPEEGLYLVKKNVTTSFYDVYTKEKFNSVFLQGPGNIVFKKFEDKINLNTHNIITLTKFNEECGYTVAKASDQARNFPVFIHEHPAIKQQLDLTPGILIYNNNELYYSGPMAEEFKHQFARDIKVGLAYYGQDPAGGMGYFGYKEGALPKEEINAVLANLENKIIVKHELLEEKIQKENASAENTRKISEGEAAAPARELTREKRRQKLQEKARENNQKMLDRVFSGKSTNKKSTEIRKKK